MYACEYSCVYWLRKAWVKNGEAPHFPLSSTTITVSVCAACQTLVMEARQFDDFWSFSGCVVGGSGMVRKLNGSPILLVPMWPGLSAGFCRLLLSTMLDVLDARLSRVLGELNPLSTVTLLLSMLSKRAEWADFWLLLFSVSLGLSKVRLVSSFRCRSCSFSRSRSH